MAVHNFAFPVLPGKEDDARKFGQEAVGSHAAHYTSLMNASGTTRVTWTLQATPAGSFILVWFEAAAAQTIFEVLATRAGEDADWMRSRIRDIGGVDMKTPMSGPQPELIMEWPRSGR
jgi:hypothetical protein